MTEQALVSSGEPATRAQVAVGLKVPVPPLPENVTLPSGSEAEPPAVSFTVAVQVVDWFTARVLSAQLTVVVTLFLFCYLLAALLRPEWF